MTPKEQKYHAMYMDIAHRVAENSYAVRKKVGCVIVRDNNILSYGWNGMPKGMDNTCEHKVYADIEQMNRDGTLHTLGSQYPLSEYTSTSVKHYKLVTKNEVSHAEENAIAKLARAGVSSVGATVYLTMAPCIHCAKLLYNCGITEVFYKEIYIDGSGLLYLQNLGVKIHKQL